MTGKERVDGNDYNRKRTRTGKGRRPGKDEIGKKGRGLGKDEDKDKDRERMRTRNGQGMDKEREKGRTGNGREQGMDEQLHDKYSFNS